MTAARDLARRLIDDLAGADFHRFPTSVAAAATFKQWLHVAVIDPAIAVLANFSAIAEPGGPAHRLTLLVYGDAVRGHTRRFEPAACAMSAGRTALRFGGSSLTSDGDVHHLVLDEPALGLRAELALRAVTAPSVLHNLPLGPLGPGPLGRGPVGPGPVGPGHLGRRGSPGSRRVLHWAVVPRLCATGTIEHAGQQLAVRDAPAYRDRNWGSFRFGDVAWDWGYATAAAGGPPCAVVFVRLMSAGRTQVLEQAVLVWWGERLLASFRGGEVEFASDGAFDGALVTVPPALALCRPGRSTGVPEVVTVTGRSSRGEVRLRFARARTARIVAPNDAPLGTTAIYESLGAAVLTGRIEGVDLDVAGHGLFEHVHG